jgi:hypothetical protein
MKKKHSKKQVEVESDEARDARLADEAADRLAQFYRDNPHRRPGCHKRRVRGGCQPAGLDRSCYVSKQIQTFRTEVWQDGSRIDCFTGILQDKAADEFIKLLESGATKASRVRCRADGATLTYKEKLGGGRVQISKPFTPCIFPE